MCPVLRRCQGVERTGPTRWLQWRRQFQVEQFSHPVGKSTYCRRHWVRYPRALAGLGDAMVGRIRRSGLVDDLAGLETRAIDDAIDLLLGGNAAAAWNPAVQGRTLGLRIAQRGQVSAWGPLPRDNFGA